MLYNKVKQDSPLHLRDRRLAQKFKVRVLKGIKALQWMVRELLGIIWRSGISHAFVCEGYPSQSFSIHQRATANKSTLVGGEQTASFVHSTSQIQGHKAFGCTTLQKRHTIQMTCFALWWFAVCLCLPWPGQIYNITGSKSFQSLFLPVKDSRYTPSPLPHTLHYSLCS